MIELTQDEIKYIDSNLKDKTLIRIARELSQARGDGTKIRRRDIIDYYNEKLGRDILVEKFGRP